MHDTFATVYVHACVHITIGKVKPAWEGKSLRDRDPLSRERLGHEDLVETLPRVVRARRAVGVQHDVVLFRGSLPAHSIRGEDVRT